MTLLRSGKSGSIRCKLRISSSFLLSISFRTRLSLEIKWKTVNLYGTLMPNSRKTFFPNGTISNITPPAISMSISLDRALTFAFSDFARCKMIRLALMQASMLPSINSIFANDSVSSNAKSKSVNHFCSPSPSKVTPVRRKSAAFKKAYLHSQYFEACKLVFANNLLSNLFEILSDTQFKCRAAKYLNISPGFLRKFVPILR
mmetsp:Transcript_11879/g.18285  ORF Transcript_11879/g.18285 Transcript_11879/m.18285 type:complete len:202 (+) Transcript_11879:1426-2031(+)